MSWEGGSMVDVVCFDLDDTLCDEVESERVARVKVYDFVGLRCPEVPRSTFQQVYEATWADLDQHYVDYVIHHGLDDRDLRLTHAHQVLQTCRINDPYLATHLTDLYCREQRHALHLFPDALPTLDAVRGRYGLSLLTNGPSAYQRQKLADLDLDAYFEHVIIAGEVGYAKPDRAIFQLLQTKCDVPATQILYVGNSQRRDVVGASNAGFTMAWLNRHGEPLGSTTPTPQYELRSLTELPSILQNGGTFRD
jgi:putative hydrolase of the HAD superfamily